MNDTKYNAKWPDNTDDMTSEIADAMDFVRKKIPFAASDHSRPRYHFAPPARIMIDTWGAIYHKGYYHLFYDMNTDGMMERFCNCQVKFPSLSNLVYQ